MHPRDYAESFAEKPAVIMAGSGQYLDYASLETGANRFAHWLRRQGVRSGEVVGLQLANDIDAFPLIWGAQRAGVHYLMISTGLTASELDHIVRDSGAHLLIRSPAAISSSSDWMPPPAVYIRTVDESFHRDLTRLSQDPIADEAPGADMMHSSGTTGKPKGVKAPVPSTLDTPTRAERIGASHFGFASDSVYLAPAPLYHAAPLRWSLAIHRHGGTVVLMERFEAEAALAAIARYGATVAQFVPTHFSRMLALTDEVRARHDISRLRTIFHAGAPCPVEVKRAMIEWVGPIVHEFYSGTEGIGITVILADEWLKRPGSVGRAIEGDIRICGLDGEPLPAGSEGVVRFAKASPFAYHNDPARTASACNQYGWPTLGDIGRVDPEGYLTLTDRKDFMIITAGVNVYPQEVENVLIAHPLVSDAAVIGLPDSDLGERVTAVIEPVQWPCEEAALIAQLDIHARASLAAAKRPRDYRLRPALGRSETGKLAKKALREELLSG